MKEFIKSNLFPFYKYYKLMVNKIKDLYFSSLNDEKKENYLSKRYYKIFGREIDWNNPKSYTEKIQYSKLYDLSNYKIMMSDKVEVKDWVKKTIGEQYLIPTICVYESVNQIDFSNLPKKFVIKLNNASATNIIVEDKNTVNESKCKSILDYWMKRNFSVENGLELHYSKIKPKILVEEFIESTDGFYEYRFLCFDGKPYYCIFDNGVGQHHNRNIYDLDWNIQNWMQGNFENIPRKIEKPENFEKMIEIASILSSGIPHVRVDLYNINGKIFFGEMTFTGTSGFQIISPESMDYYLGSLWNLNVE